MRAQVHHRESSVPSQDAASLTTLAKAPRPVPLHTPVNSGSIRRVCHSTKCQSQVETGLSRQFSSGVISNKHAEPSVVKLEQVITPGLVKSEHKIKFEARPQQRLLGARMLHAHASGVRVSSPRLGANETSALSVITAAPCTVLLRDRLIKSGLQQVGLPRNSSEVVNTGTGANNYQT